MAVQAQPPWLFRIMLRGYRPRTWATRATVTALAGALGEWRERFPEAQPVLLGEFSRRAGGRVRPHKSHCSGRDVDVGYVLRGDEADEERFQAAGPHNLDVARTWTLLSAFLAGGAAFWQQTEAQLDAAISGYLVMQFRCERDMQHQEMHPAGDEVLHL